MKARPVRPGRQDPEVPMAPSLTLIFPPAPTRVRTFQGISSGTALSRDPDFGQAQWSKSTGLVNRRFQDHHGTFWNYEPHYDFTYYSSGFPRGTSAPERTIDESGQRPPLWDDFRRMGSNRKVSRFSVLIHPPPLIPYCYDFALRYKSEWRIVVWHRTGSCAV